MNKLYPLKFQPIFKDKIWGGNKIHTQLGLDFSPLPNCGEAWMLSGVDEEPSIITNGFFADNELNELVEVFMSDLVGDKVFEKFGSHFPLLIKFIDSNDYLSIQVHPDDELASKRHKSFGKTEMWYILDAEPGAELITGFNKKLTKQTYLQHLESKTLKNILNFEKVKKGDVFFIPSGRVHALGPGVLLAEIQQTSDITYRIYDWDRVDDKGKPRQLHTELAADAIDFDFLTDYKTYYAETTDKTVKLVDCPQFHTSLLNFDQPITKDYTELDSFVILICAEGSFELLWEDGREKVQKGEVVLVPAIIKNISMVPYGETRLLEVYIA